MTAYGNNNNNHNQSNSNYQFIRTGTPELKNTIILESLDTETINQNKKKFEEEYKKTYEKSNQKSSELTSTNQKNKQEFSYDELLTKFEQLTEQVNELKTEIHTLKNPKATKEKEESLKEKMKKSNLNKAANLKNVKELYNEKSVNVALIVESYQTMVKNNKFAEIKNGVKSAKEHLSEKIKDSQVEKKNKKSKWFDESIDASQKQKNKLIEKYSEASHYQGNKKQLKDQYIKFKEKLSNSPKDQRKQIENDYAKKIQPLKEAFLNSSEAYHTKSNELSGKAAQNLIHKDKRAAAAYSNNHEEYKNIIKGERDAFKMKAKNAKLNAASSINKKLNNYIEKLENASSDKLETALNKEGIKEENKDKVKYEESMNSAKKKESKNAISKTIENSINKVRETIKSTSEAYQKGKDEVIQKREVAKATKDFNMNQFKSFN